MRRISVNLVVPLLAYAVLLLGITNVAAEDVQSLRASEDGSSKFRPNVVMIVVDDLGWADLGFRNDNQIKTPNINTLYERGVELTRYYVHTVCSPSRASLMTGRYSHHNGVHNWLKPAGNIAVRPEEIFLSDRFKDAGYDTYMVGKWHLGHHKWKYLPHYRGFDSYYGFVTGGGDYFLGRANVDRIWYHYLEATAPHCNAETCVRIPWEAENRYSTDVFSEKAVEAINRHGESKSGNPFFLLVTYQGVHGGGFQPNQVPLHYVEPYMHFPPGRRRQFAGMVAAVDYGVGNITKALHDNGFTDDNTLIILTTDNGGPINTGDACGSSNYPYRGGKHSLYEGGVRGTAFVTGYGIPGKGVYDGLMHITDWTATLADVAGYSLRTNLPLDSESHWAHLTSTPESLIRETPVRSEVVLGNVSDHGRGFGMIIDGHDGKQWKIISDSPGYPNQWSTLDLYGESENENLQGPDTPCEEGFCLYELTSDPRERTDLSQDEAYATVLKTLKQRLLDEWDTSYDIPRDCNIQPIAKDHERVGATWWPYCPNNAVAVEQ
mmetsp:Transcript_87/g.292  ORF Transcript_87/g.292 Transcript_87/m.292 type:complete len:549 (+) Transcript_87:133-1779(+)|eukprot:CAMPEP_0171487672 /NCGR_PEP_ID=MMETSP0958-20121227/1779_1 /TAXON_ID=87120 /ORGANISM="Aurantiochytrium limacinum, Strain ATCCMYA-1381" /LENGTH=548 /DNA_ID=CAMNT_0012020695 /DNA_START=65 /DNA_END=1711 /DNA_ORIENTATION=-